MYAAGALERALAINRQVWRNQAFESKASKLLADIKAGGWVHGQVVLGCIAWEGRWVGVCTGRRVGGRRALSEWLWMGGQCGRVDGVIVVQARQLG